MNEEEGLDMDLSSGIAAFESKHFSTATRLLAPRAEQRPPGQDQAETDQPRLGQGLGDDVGDGAVVLGDYKSLTEGDPVK